MVNTARAQAPVDAAAVVVEAVLAMAPVDRKAVKAVTSPALPLVAAEVLAEMAGPAGAALAGHGDRGPLDMAAGVAQVQEA